MPRITIYSYKMSLINLNIRVSALKNHEICTLFVMDICNIHVAGFWLVNKKRRNAQAKMARYTSMELARGQDFNRILASNDENHQSRPRNTSTGNTLSVN